MERIDTSISVEWIIVADAAEVVNGKLYLLGGGWDVLVINRDFPVQRVVGLAVAFRVPWTETNRRRNAEVVVTDEDANATLARMTFDFEVGRPPGTLPGQAQRVQFAANLPLTFKSEGTWVITARIDGDDLGRSTLRVARGRSTRDG